MNPWPICRPRPVSPRRPCSEEHRALIDAGVIGGIPSRQADELAAARKRVAVLEAELAPTRDARSWSTRGRWCPQNADARSLKD